MEGYFLATFNSFVETSRLYDLLTISDLSHNRTSHCHFHCKWPDMFGTFSASFRIVLTVNDIAAKVMCANHFVVYKALCTCQMCDLLYLLRNEDICLFQFPYSV